MIIFASCLLGAGAVLSLVAGVHGLLVIALAVSVASAAVTVFRSFQAGPTYSLGLTLVIAIFALQIGYGLAIVARAALGARLRRPSGSAPDTPGHEPIRDPEHSLGRES